MCHACEWRELCTSFFSLKALLFDINIYIHWCCCFSYLLFKHAKLKSQISCAVNLQYRDAWFCGNAIYVWWYATCAVQCKNTTNINHSLILLWKDIFEFQLMLSFLVLVQNNPHTHYSKLWRGAAGWVDVSTAAVAPSHTLSEMKCRTGKVWRECFPQYFARCTRRTSRDLDL